MSGQLFAHREAAFPEPRPFQRQTLVAIAAGIVAGHKNQMIMAATGAGKSYTGLRLVDKALKRGKRVTFLCDRRSLIDQTSAVADSYGLSDHGVIQGNHPREDWSQPFQIASVQTVMSRGWPATDVLIVDEAHTMYDVWTQFAMESKAHVIGLSATPFSAGLGKVFTNLINAATMHELTESGVLVPLRVLSCRRPDMAGAKVNDKGEWSTSAAGERGMEIIGDVVAEWLRHAEGRKTIVFGATIAHCEELCRQFNEVGVMAATFTNDTPDEERPRLIKEYRKPDSCLRVLISVEALAKGFDVPDVGCVVDCRPLRRSLSIAIQMWGRGLRSFPGKTDCLLLDHSGNITRFAEDFTRVFFDGLESLDMGEKLDRAIRKDEKDERERKGCPSCGYKPFRQRCMGCGFEIVSSSLVAHEAGQMQEIVLGKSQVAANKVDLWQQVCRFANATAWVKNKESWAKRQFMDICKEWPPSRLHPFTATPNGPVSGDLARRFNGEHQRFVIATRAARAKQAVAA